MLSFLEIEQGQHHRWGVGSPGKSARHAFAHELKRIMAAFMGPPLNLLEQEVAHDHGDGAVIIECDKGPVAVGRGTGARARIDMKSAQCIALFYSA